MTSTSPSDLYTRECMTAPAIVVGPDDPASRIAMVCLANQFTGVPVADAAGRPLGVVSIVDLRCNDASMNSERRNAWLRLAANDGPVDEADLEALTQGLGPVRELMASPAVCVDENAPVSEAAKLISEHSIKRVVVTRDGQVVGVVTRADLLRAYSGVGGRTQARTDAPAFNGHAANGADQVVSEPAAPLDVSADSFRNMVAVYQRSRTDVRRLAVNEQEKQQQAEVEKLLKEPLMDLEWRELIAKAQRAAEHGGTECVLMRFPARLCEDRGRAINLPEPDWPSSLRGKPALVVERWRQELKPLGFRLAARIATFPGGLPGEVEMSLIWR